MSNKFLAFLGTNDYLRANYFLGEDKVPGVRFIQEATVRLNCVDWNKNDKIIIFCTDESESMNWEDDGQRNSEGKVIKQDGLKTRLKKLNLTCPFEIVKIPGGSSEKEIWEIFTIVYKKIESRDEIIFDITHGFRSLPMLALAILNYAKLLKEIRIKGIYYGAFETLGSYHSVKEMPAEKRNAPIFDLTAFAKLIEWTKAVGDFLDFGNADEINRLTKEESVSIIKEQSANKNEAILLRRFCEQLRRLSTDISSSRGIDIETFKYFSDFNIKDFLSKESFIGPFNPLMNKIIKKVESFIPNSIQNGYMAVEWCLDHNLIQQGYTIFQETMISEIADMYLDRDKIHNPDWRDLISQSLKIAHNIKLQEKEEFRNPANWRSPAKDSPEIVQKIIDNTSKEFLKTYDKLSQRRNDVNHASFNNASVSAAKLRASLEKIFSQFMESR